MSGPGVDEPSRVSQSARAGGPANNTPVPTFGEATRTWAKIGLLSFGGPAGQIALMHRIVVDEKKWITEDQFLHALNYCMLLPGPEAQQLAIYVGWLLHRIRGGLTAGLLFILPGFVVIMALSYLYVLAGDLSIVQGVFLGLKAAVIAIVFQAVFRIGRRSLKSMYLQVIAVSAFAGMFVLGVSFPIIIVIAAIAGLAMARVQTNQRQSLSTQSRATTPSFTGRHARHIASMLASFGALWLVPIAVMLIVLGPENVFTTIGIFFSKMAVITFGGAYAVLSYVAQEAVQAYAWLSPAEMIDGLAMAESTPGPLIMTVQFVGFVAAYRDPGMLSPALAGFLGGTLTTWVTFTPCFLWVFLGAPYIEKLRDNAALSAVFSAITAAVVGAIANLALWFTIHTLFADVQKIEWGPVSTELPILTSLAFPVLGMTVVAIALTFIFRAPVLAILGVAGVAGVAVTLLGL